MVGDRVRTLGAGLVTLAVVWLGLIHLLIAAHCAARQRVVVLECLEELLGRLAECREGLLLGHLTTHVSSATMRVTQSYVMHSYREQALVMGLVSDSLEERQHVLDLIGHSRSNRPVQRLLGIWGARDRRHLLWIGLRILITLPRRLGLKDKEHRATLCVLLHSPIEVGGVSNEYYQ